MSAQVVPLGELTRIRTGKLDANASSSDGTFPFFTCAREPLRISSYSYDCECVLVAGNGDLNVKYHSGKFDAYQRTYIVESLDNRKLSARYLYYFLDKYLVKLREQSIGGIIKYIKLGNLSEAPIPLPPLSEQCRIAAILDKADALRAKRREAIAKLDQLLQSVFLDMFGEPLANARGWREKQLSEVARVQTGGTPPSSEDGMFDGDVPFITPGDLGGEVKVWRRTLTQEGAQRVRTAAAGSTLVCCIGTIGKMGIVWRESAFNQQINAVTWNEDVLPLFGYHALLFLSEEIAHRGASTTVPILKKSEFERLSIIVPPRERQREFTRVAERIATQSAASVRAQGASRQLFSSLQQRLFEN